MDDEKASNDRSAAGEWRRRPRYYLDGGALAVVDQQIRKFSRTGMMIRLRRHQMVRFLLQRGIWCRCGAGDRELQPPEPIEGANVLDPDKSYQIDVGETGEAIIDLHRHRLRSPEKKGSLDISKQQMLRALVLKGARCECPLPEWGVAGDEPKAKKAGQA